MTQCAVGRLEVLGVNSTLVDTPSSSLRVSKAKGRGRVLNGASVGSMAAQKPSMPRLEPFSSAIMSSFRLLMLDGPEVLP